MLPAEEATEENEQGDFGSSILVGRVTMVAVVTVTLGAGGGGS